MVPGATGQPVTRTCENDWHPVPGPAVQPAGLTAASGIELIRAERRRQVESEGWTAEHDDSHGPAVLLAAADCYAFYRPGDTSPPWSWPWDASWWKPKDTLRNLVRAGALAQASADSAHRRGEEAREVFAHQIVRQIAAHIDSLASPQPPDDLHARIEALCDEADRGDHDLDSLAVALRAVLDQPTGEAEQQ